VSESRPAAVIILAAGEGKRMKSRTPKVLHSLCGRSMLGHALAAAEDLFPERIVAVIGHSRNSVGGEVARLAPEAVVVVQEQQLGTGHAVRMVTEAVGVISGVVVVTYGDMPLLRGETLRDLVAAHGATADVFQFGVDHDVYRERGVARRRDTVVYYARYETDRRAVPHGLMALAELHRRRPDLRIALFGTPHQLPTPFPYEHLGLLSPLQLSWLYSEATVGLCLSLTNFSLMPQEMIACGLPCVELAGVSAEGIFGEDGPIELAPLDPWLLADALERLLDDRDLWERRSAAGIAFASHQTWDGATDAVEAGIRHALRSREQGECEDATHRQPRPN